MPDQRSRPILIAGAGIAGLTAAIAFGLRGYPVRLFEQAEQLQAVGAGIQLSPNATHILKTLGVLDFLLPNAVQPPAVLLRDAASLKLLARIPLGELAQSRWGAPYLAVHRADLQAALVQRAGQMPGVELITGARVTGCTAHAAGIAVAVSKNGDTTTEYASLLIGADGVWSAIRSLGSGNATAAFTGELAWRATVETDSPGGKAFAAIAPTECVTTFLSPTFHLVAYPVRAGRAINLVAFTKGVRISETWSGHADIALLQTSVRRAAARLKAMIELAGPWTVWPVHTVDQKPAWVSQSMALIGDAAHAMTPFAAQGAAMAIEDAATLAAFVSKVPDGGLADALNGWEHFRRPRIARVTSRGALNKLAWNAGGPVALARNVVLGLRSPQRLAADLDWLYGWRMPTDQL
ncbi:salicylate hydroxylase [Mesorhizobium sp. Root554]|uniref:FAD-dependent monooxygenase n=1 Tax=unclassified Mesorhizobium TaxID=325217 RepID=UPI0006FBDFCE|nr:MULTISPECIES: FAD-dependent monooxygenase [unclassified Mesorhizobium]KQZ13534.1 salicylate hydroxylase [Mesorhizobium sp. Root1471]KQZ36046.1 salicylate hydroxylase [Mesorhizobium sp. Root554]